jgi:hypothetical protein
LAGARQLVAFPETWNGKSREELAVLFLKDKIQANDIIIAPTPQDAPLWYYSRLYSIPERYFHRTTEFDRAFIVTVPVLGQYRDDVLKDYGLTDVVDLNTMKLIKEINGINIFEVMHK